MPQRIIGVAVAMLVLAGQAEAADLALRLSRITRQAVSLAATPDVLVRPLSASDRLQVEATVGVAYQRGDEDGHTLTSPFLLDFSKPDAAWHIQVSSDGYTRSTSEGETGVGLADLVVGGTYTWLPVTGWGVTSLLELTLPTHGDVGSQSASQDGGLLVTFAPSAWSWTAGGILLHGNESLPGVSRYTKTGLVQTKYTGDDGTAWLMRLTRSTTRGGSGATAGNLEFDFPLPALKNVTGAVIATRVFTSGLQSNKLSLQLTFAGWP